MAIAASFPSIKPSLSLDFANVGALDPRVTFTRSTTGTYYDGVTTAKAEENLLTYSQEFDNSYWGKDRLTVTANQTNAPDGTATADLVTEDATTNTRSVMVNSLNPNNNSGTYTASIFVQAGTGQYCSISVAENGGTNYVVATFDLSGATVVKTGSNGSGWSHSASSITSVGGGWFRLTLTAITGGVFNRVGFIPNNSNNPTYTNWGRQSYLGTGATYYIWGAQLEQRSAVTAYTPTTTQPITNYIPVLQTAAAGQARFDHNPTTGEALGLLIEEQRTNLLPRSEEFSNAYWVKDKTSITANTVVAPDGTLTGDLMIATTTLGSHQIYSSAISISAGNPYTYTVYAKYGGYQWMSISAYDGGEKHSWFDLLNGVPGSNFAGNTSSMTPVGNGWYRCVVTRTVAAATTYGQFFVSNTASTTAFAGDGYSGIYIWGAQLEAGAFPTSYIPTVATQETRNADAASMTGADFSSWFNNGEGTLYVNGTSFDSVGGIYAAINSPTGGSRILAIARRVGNTGTSAIVSLPSGAAALTASNYAGTSNDKAVAAYAANDFAGTANAIAVSTASAGTVGTLSQMEIGRQTHLSSIAPGGTIKKISYYPQRLTNAQLQALTA